MVCVLPKLFHFRFFFLPLKHKHFSTKLKLVLLTRSVKCPPTSMCVGCNHIVLFIYKETTLLAYATVN